jgi:hypothetical protein
LVGKSPGTDDGNGDGRAAIGVTAGPGCVIGRDALRALPRGGSLVFAVRRFSLADLTLALRAGFRAATFLRADDARFFAAAFFTFRFFAMIALHC